jgi:hypothetical protein
MLVVASLASVLVWGSAWWVRHSFVGPRAALPVAGAVVVPEPCITPVGDIFSPGCPPGTGDGGVSEGAAGAEAAEAVGTPVPCITPAGAIFAPDCAAAPAGSKTTAPDTSAAVPQTGGEGGTPKPCITPPGAIFAPGC